MKISRELKSFDDILSTVLNEYASYAGTNAVGTASASKNKFSPATIMNADPLRLKNPDVKIGQAENELKADSPLIYPFESIFAELAEIYSRIDAVEQTMKGASDINTISVAKREAVKNATEDLNELKKKFHKIIYSIEEVTI